VTLLREIRAVLNPNGKLLTAAVGPTKDHVDDNYDVVNVAAQVDFINLMTYDLHNTWEEKSITRMNAPLYSSSSSDFTAREKYYNVHACVEYWISMGAPRDKLVLGLALYGRSFTLVDASNHGVGAPTVSGGGDISYNQICWNLNNGWNRKYVTDLKVPYAFSGTQWVGYDDKESLTAKIEYIVMKNLGGAMIWSIEKDDYGECFCGKLKCKI
jgi:chitinase